MKVVQINSVVGHGSTGRIVDDIGKVALERGHSSFIGYGRGEASTTSVSYRIGSALNIALHAVRSSVFDGQGLGSRGATTRLIDRLEREKPDIVGLHNIHGYYLNYPVLFDFLRNAKCSVVWTMHDCWPFTGHCAHFGRFDCSKWRTECFECPMTHYYPRSVLDRSRENFRLKKQLFQGLDDLTVVTPSRWLKNIVKGSFLSQRPIHVIHNGVDLDVFRPSLNEQDKAIILGVANAWTDRKGFSDFAKIRRLVPASIRIVLVGVTASQARNLPAGIEGVEKTNNIDSLVRWYQRASVLINPTYSDNFPSVNLEALACGVPVVTYDTGGSSEAIDATTGIVVVPGDTARAAEAAVQYCDGDQAAQSTFCRDRAEALFSNVERFNDHVKLYESL